MIYFLIQFNHLFALVFGTVAGTIIGDLFTEVLALIIQLILWLGLVKHFFDFGWLKDLAVAMVAIIIFAIIAAILSLIGFALISFL